MKHAPLPARTLSLAMAAAKTFLERLDGEARDLLLAVARPISHAKGERLVRHGDPSRGAYVLREGAAEATVTLPGGEKLTVARFDAGSVFGEMALIERGTCTATVIATEKLDGWFIERDDFRSLVAQRVPAALRVQHALTLILSEQAPPAQRQGPRRPRLRRQARDEDRTGADPLAGAKRLKKASFDFKPFLPHLADLRRLRRRRDRRDPRPSPRSSSCRAATPSSSPASPPPPASSSSAAPSRSAPSHDQRERRMAVLGPGQLVGYMSALEKGVHGSDAVVREQRAAAGDLPRRPSTSSTSAAARRRPSCIA